jgi:hypothetical protein
MSADGRLLKFASCAHFATHSGLMQFARLQVAKLQGDILGVSILERVGVSLVMDEVEPRPEGQLPHGFPVLFP